MITLRKLILTSTIWGVSGLSMAAISPAQSYLYRLRGYPKTANNCHAEAASLAERFKQITGARALGECTEITDTAYDISIVYTYSQEIPLVTTYPEMLLQDRIHIFATEAACKQQLSIEADYFKEKTSLEPLVQFCAMNETYYGKKTWAIRIDAFGNAAVKPYWSESSMMGNVSGMSETAAEQWIQESYQHAGIDARIVHLRQDDKGERQFSMFYYHDKPLDIKIEVLAAELDQSAQCEAELAKLRSIVAADKPQALFCTDNPYSHSHEVLGVIELGSWFKQSHSVESFKNYADCDANRDSTLEIYRTTAGRNVLTGLCTLIGSEWRLNLFEKVDR